MSKWLRILHRDLGFLAVGLTIVFCISGISLNHLRDWNPNYSVTQERTDFKHQVSELSDEQLTALVSKELKVDEKVKTVYWASPAQVKVFYKNGVTVIIDTTQDVAIKERVEKRVAFYYMNALHLNRIDGIWIYISDFFAIALIFLAISGLFIVKGKKGIKGRGGIYTLIGALIPLAVIFFSIAQS